MPTRRKDEIEEASSQPPYWWFQGPSVEELTRQLNAKPGARLEVHLHEHLMSFRVVGPGEIVTEGSGGGINDSHACPPDCIPR